jgi:uncharacterized protein (DUF433 family)
MASSAAKMRDARLDDVDWLRAEYAAKSAKQIAMEYGFPRDAVYEALRAAGIPRRVNRHGPPIVDRVGANVADQVVARYVAGGSIERVAEELGLTLGVVGGVLEDRTRVSAADGSCASGIKRSRSEAAALAHGKKGGPQPNRREWPAELVAEVLARYGAGESGERIAAELGLPASSVYRLLRHRGVLRSRS